jgi:hypothetical protein
MINKINDWVTYILVAILFAPHASKECVEEVCDGVVFVSPTVQAFMTPFVKMDISAHGFLIQLLWSIPFVLTMYMLFKARDSQKFGKYFQIYAIRWAIFFIILVFLYNILFWAGLRDYTLPSFIF